MPRAIYARLSGDARASSLVLARARHQRRAVDRRTAPAAARGPRPRPAAVDRVRAISLRIFDRAFLVTYARRAVAVGIGLLGVAFAASSAALARRGEFAMLRHLGMLRRRVLAMLAGEAC